MSGVWVQCRGGALPAETVEAYFRRLRTRCYKVLLMREAGEPTLPVYLRALLREMLGCKSLISALKGEPDFVTLLCILESMAQEPDRPAPVVRGDVFHAMNLCEKLAAKTRDGEAAG